METSPREQYPESVIEAEHLSEPEAIDRVRIERMEVEDQVTAAEDLLRNLGPGATRDDMNTAIQFLNESQARMDTFNAMWTDFGGDDIDAAEAAVAAATAAGATGTDTRLVRAQNRLAAAEDAFYGRMVAESGNIQDEAEAMDDIEDEKRAVTAADVEDAHDQALEEAADRAGTRVTDVDTAHDEAIAEYSSHTGTMYNPDQGRTLDVDTAHDEAIAEYATRTGSAYDPDQGRTTDVDTAHDEAIAEYEVRGGSPYDVDAGRIVDVDAARVEADLEREARLDAAGTRVVDINDAHEQALEENVDRAGTRVVDIDAAHQEALEVNRQIDINNRWYNRARARMNLMFTNGMDRLRNTSRRNKILMAAGAVAAVGLAIWAVKSGSGHQEAHSFVTPPSGPKTPTTPEIIGGADPSTATATVPEVLTPLHGNLPELGSHSHLYGWAAEAFGPDKAMDALHEMGKRAADAGHTVEWHGSGTHEWVEVDGKTGVKNIFDALRPFAK